MTVVWIWEGDRDRYEEALPATPPPPVRFHCPYCAAEFPAFDLFDSHVRFDHPLDVPLLFIHGEQALRELTVRTAPSVHDLRLCNTSECQLRISGGCWQTLSPKDLFDTVCRSSRGTLELRLVNARKHTSGTAETHYLLHYRIPDPALLDRVDKAFIGCLAVDHPGHEELDRFEKTLPDEPAAREYASALENYVIGILIKERRYHSSTPLHAGACREKMSEALGVLECFSGPVAQLVAACIRFNLNDFRPVSAGPIDPRLAHAAGFFRSLTERPQSPPPTFRAVPGRLQPACPIDGVTSIVLRACEGIAGRNRPETSILEDLTRLLVAEPGLGEHDLIKIHVLCAHGATRLGSPDAERYLKALQFNTVFGPWAEKMLEGAKTS